ncbi:MAG: ATP-dependent RecD-like DNA helicase [Flavobacteriales bacterium]
MSQTQNFKNLLLKGLNFEPTVAQKKACGLLAYFVCEKKVPLFVLKGYAGTGKTTVLSSLVNHLGYISLESIQLAPTGRAAKVIASYSGKPAYTIHKKIYSRKRISGKIYTDVAYNKHKNTIFIVDEASMITNQSSNGSWLQDERRLLDDLVQYVFSGKNNALILVGDTAQLPPVEDSHSPALDLEYLTERYDLPILNCELNEVVRQEAASGILFNATRLRNELKEETRKFPKFHLGFSDFLPITGETLQDELESAYSKMHKEGVMIICRSNKRANLFNMQVRARILWFEEELCPGDLLMVVKNNYFWIHKEHQSGFIANGDIIEVKRVLKTEDIFGLRFANIIARYTDNDNEPEFECKIMLDALTDEGASLSRDKLKMLYYALEEDFSEISDKKKRTESIFNSPYFNALQVKYAYAITCHKSQGGQWPIVFVDQGYLTEEMINESFRRWLYTATTRATEKLYLINFNPQFFEG